MSTSFSNYDVVVYRANCPDGVVSAYAFYKAFPDKTVRYIGGKHMTGLVLDVINANVLFLDFALPLDEMKVFIEKNQSVYVIDHHRSSTPLNQIKHSKFGMTLDETRSTAQIAWGLLQLNSPCPWFVDHVADFWKWSIPESKATTRTLISKGYFDMYQCQAFRRLDTIPHDNFLSFKIVGDVMLEEDEFKYQSICRYAKSCSFIMPDGNTIYNIKAVSCAGWYKSEVGNRLCQNRDIDFAVIYNYDIESGEWWLSMYAHPESKIDLNNITRHFKADGEHPKAAGCTIPASDHIKNYIFPLIPTLSTPDSISANSSKLTKKAN